MARRGKFSVGPRTSPNLTNTIVAIAREMQQQRDQNLMDAWQKGGTFEGKPATDDLVLKHWNDRLKNLDKADPLYNTYKNTITQYTYSIAESKQSTLYAQGKINDSQMASFYLKWAKHPDIPKDSEFYRVLQRDGAQFMRAAKSKSDAAAKAAMEKTYQDAQGATSKKYEATGLYLTDVVTQLAKSHALIGLGGNENLTNFDPTDPAAMLSILSQVMGNAKGGPHAGEAVAMGNTLYHDPLTHKAITGRDIVAKLKALDPHFDGNFTAQYFAGALDRQGEGQAIRLKRATDTGHQTDANNIKSWQDFTSEVGRETRAWTIEKSYKSARSAFEDTWNSTTASPESKLAAWNTYSAKLVNLAGSKDIATDDATRTRLLAEATGDGNVDSLNESFTGLNSANAGQGGGPTDIKETHAWLETYQQHADAVGSGKAVWTTGSFDGKGNFTPGAGKEIGAASLSDAQNSGPAGAVLMYLPQSNGAKPIPVYVAGKTVTAVVTDQDGFKVNSTSPNDSVLGTAHDVPIDGVMTRVWSFKASDGREMFTRDLYNNPNLKVEDGPNGIVIHVVVQLPVGADGKPDPNQITKDNPFFTKDDKGNVFVNPGAAIMATDAARSKAGPDPITDSFSPTIAALLGTTDGQRTLQSLSKDPGFTAQLDNESQANAGAKYDQATQSWVPGTGDASILALNTAQAKVLPDVAGSVKDLVSTFQGMFSRQTTAPTFQANTRSQEDLGGGKLPSDAARGTGFDALAKVFQPFTNLFSTPSGAPGGFQLNIGTDIKVPGAPSNVPTAPATTPTPTPTPAATTPVASTYTSTPAPTPASGAAPAVGGGSGDGYHKSGK